MVTGRVPFEADTPFAIIMKHIGEPLPPPRSIQPDLPQAAEEVLTKALTKNPDERYQKAGDMARALQKAVGGTADQTLAATPITPIAPAPRSPKLAACLSFSRDEIPLRSLSRRAGYVQRALDTPTG